MAIYKHHHIDKSGSYIAAFILLPIAFVILTISLLFIAIMPVIRPYVDMAGLIIGNSEPQITAGRDLFAETAAAAAAGKQTGENNETQQAASAAPGQSDTQTQAGPPMIPLSSVIYPNPGDLYGMLTIEGTTIDAPVFWGDSPTELNAGVGTYTGGWLPGYGYTIMMAGHRTGYLRDLGSAQIGGIIKVETYYETYMYEITDIAVHHMSDSSAYDFSRDDENIIIYTCYPFNFIGAAKERYFVYGELISGMQIDRDS